MRSSGSLRSAVLTLAAAVGVFGLSFGVLAVAAGLTPAAAIAMSMFVFAGGSQFAAVGVVAAGGSPIAAVVSGLLLNARYVAFGVAVAPALHGGPLRRALAAHFVIDESAALALARRDDDPGRIFWLTGIALGTAWITGTTVGAFAGSAIGDPAAYGLDVAFPAGFLALLAPLLDGRRARMTALTGAAIAVALLPVAPPGVPVIAAAAGVLAGIAVSQRPDDTRVPGRDAADDGPGAAAGEVSDASATCRDGGLR